MMDTQSSAVQRSKFNLTEKKTIHTESDTQSATNHKDDMADVDFSLYPTFIFETPVHLYVWPILVTVLVILNVLVIMVLLQKPMRSATYIIMAAIAVSDSLTGLVSIPSYVTVYMSNDDYVASDVLINILIFNCINNLPTEEKTNAARNTMALPGNETRSDGSGVETCRQDSHIKALITFIEQNEIDGFYAIPKNTCKMLITSKYFALRFVHTISILFTVFLAIQRFVIIRFPHKSHQYFRARNIVFISLCIVLLSPILHIYIVFTGPGGSICGLFFERPCVAGCIFLWVKVFICHLFPCTILIIFTILFVRSLKAGRFERRRTESGQSRTAQSKNKRIVKIVIAILIACLIAEVPYGLYIAWETIIFHAGTDTRSLRSKRLVHMTYEFLLLLSFHANFYIYTVLNKRFRINVKIILCSPFTKLRHVKHACCLSKQPRTVTVFTSKSSSSFTGSTNV